MIRGLITDISSTGSCPKLLELSVIASDIFTFPLSLMVTASTVPSLLSFVGQIFGENVTVTAIISTHTKNCADYGYSPACFFIEVKESKLHLPLTILYPLVYFL